MNTAIPVVEACLKAASYVTGSWISTSLPLGKVCDLQYSLLEYFFFLIEHILSDDDRPLYQLMLSH